MSCFDDQVMLYHILARFNLQFIKLLHIIRSVVRQVKDESTSELPRDGLFFPLCISIKVIPFPAEVKECSQKSIRSTG